MRHRSGIWRPRRGGTRKHVAPGKASSSFARKRVPARQVPPHSRAALPHSRSCAGRFSSLSRHLQFALFQRRSDQCHPAGCPSIRCPRSVDRFCLEETVASQPGFPRCRSPRRFEKRKLTPGPELHWQVSPTLDRRRSPGEAELIRLAREPVLPPREVAYSPDVGALEWRAGRLRA